MAIAAKVYAKQLIAKGHGYPLWVPEPTGRQGEVQPEVQIGDVGVITKAGSFFRLFNAMHPPNHSINGGRVPAGFEPLVLPNRVIETIPNFLEPGPVYSESVRNVDVSVDASVDALGGHVGASYRFTCDQNQGALLVLKDYANREQAIAEDTITKYVGKHCQSWRTFATETFGLPAKLNNIVLVGGWVKTSAWAVAAFLDKGPAHEVLIGTGDGPYPKFNVSVSVANNVSMSVDHRSGPVRPAAPGQAPEAPVQTSIAFDQTPAIVRDQCIFLEIYKAKKRLREAIPFMRAAAEPTNNHRPPTPDYDTAMTSSSTDSDEDIMHAEPVIMSFCDPLEDVLDYILEHSDADIAVTSQSCLRKLSLLAGHEAHTHDLEGLQQCLPEICVDEQAGTLFFPDPSTAQQEAGHAGVSARFDSSVHAQVPASPRDARANVQDTANEYNMGERDHLKKRQQPHSHRGNDQRASDHHHGQYLVNDQPMTQEQPHDWQPRQPYGSYMPMSPPQLYQGNSRSRQPSHNTTEYHSQDGSHRNTPHVAQYPAAYANNGYRQDRGAVPQRTDNRHAQDVTQQMTQGPVYARPSHRLTSFGGPLHIRWTAHALRELEQMTAAQCRGHDLRMSLEGLVRAYASSNVPDANRAIIRKPASVDRQEPYGDEYMTVAYKTNNRDLGMHHVYIGRR